MNSIKERAREQFRRAADELGPEIKAVLAEHSAKGALRSGATIKRTVRTFETVTADALDRAMAEASNRLQSRGREWHATMDAIELELSAHVDRAPDLLAKPLSFMPQGPALAEPLIEDARRSLLRQLHDYRDNWTAPPGKRWTERHPAIYAIALLVAGALVGELVKVGIELVKPATIGRAADR